MPPWARSRRRRKKREELPEGVHLPSPSIQPLILAIGMTITVFGIVFRGFAIALGEGFSIPIIMVLGLIITLAGFVGWIREGRKASAAALRSNAEAAPCAAIPWEPVLASLPAGESKERKMTQTRSRVWVEVFAVVVTLALGGMMLYALLPFITAPDQQVVPPPQQMDLGQTLLTLFIAATAIGAPLTVGIVLVLLAKFVSRRVPASSSVAPEIPSPKAKPRAVEQSAGDVGARSVDLENRGDGAAVDRGGRGAGGGWRRRSRSSTSRDSCSGEEIP